MFKLIVFGLITCFCINCPFAQNLVPNPYFDDTIGCPDDVSNYLHEEVRLAKGWDSFGATPDYYNSCGTPAWSVPANLVGYQNAVSGDAYCGMITYDDSTSYGYVKNYRELIGAQLITPLVAGHKYIASIDVSLADSAMFAANNMGVSFSTIRYADSNSAPINNHAMVYDTAVITETGVWTTISGSFVADSDYTYVIVGNFFQDDSTRGGATGVQGTENYTYYYVGYVSVVPDTATGINNVATDNNISIYPNPSTGKFHVSGTQKITAVQLYDMEGRLVFAQPVQSNNAIINVSGLADGVYYASLLSEGEAVEKKLIITK